MIRSFRCDKTEALSKGNSVSESMQKLFIADFSAMMFRDDIGKKDAADRPTDDIPKKVG